MPRLTHKAIVKGLFAAVLLASGTTVAQTDTQLALTQIGYLIDDALFFSDKYITPATDAAVYQSSSAWVRSPKAKGLFEVSFGLHANVFFTPQRDRTLKIQNSDFSFFQLEQGTEATVPTALGNDRQVYLVGTLGGSQVRLETPEGIDMQTVAYPYLQGSIGLWYDTELIAKYSTRVKLKKSNYQVYGVGLKHTVSRYFKGLEENHIHVSLMAGYSNEEVSFNFLDVKTDYGTLGIDEITGLVDTWQFQLNGSKEFGKWEAMAGFIVNTSDIRYNVSGPKGSIEQILPLQQILNMRLEEIYKTKVNYIGEAAIRYNIGNFDVQTILAFGKFVNTNISLHYTINNKNNKPQTQEL
ncbi:DUF6588 family protein [uncultured Flavobacterium sp.]|uniref:DUF6588 family protein n=1 Tax=uncultured Flavobacterium sp. TaxID=165435 RepID=UPI0025CBE115|nr:DUF6588 family protein [uncultured Flavobacterium sp.]